MSFNIFGPSTKDAIKVGYISTERGFIDGVSICEANDYAQLNPGTQFAFRTRDKIEYLNINEVNQLTPNDIVSSGSTCSGIQFQTNCGPAKSYFYGGGGIGVQGNPVIGEDGALLAVDLVHKGYGYQYPPIVEVKDNCGIGAGAVTRAVLGEVVETVEYYDQEGDFEEYEICDPTDVGYGRMYDPNGKDIGEWDPTLYANLSDDPIAREIREYQTILQKLQTPWWTTRLKAPLKVTSENKEGRTKFDVTYSSWNEFMNSYAISPAPSSNVKGSDFAGIPYAFEWEEDFPFTGEYTFRGLCDNKAELYIDNVKIDDLRKFNDTPNIVKKDIKAGVHRIRLDLLNVPIKEALPVKLQPTAQPVVQSTPVTSTETKIICHASGGFGGLKDTPKQDKVGNVIVGKGSGGSPGLAPGLTKPASTQASGGGAGLKAGSSTASGANLDGAEIPIAPSTDGFISGPYYGLPYGNWWIINGSLKGNIFTGGGFTLFNGGYYADAKSGYGYGGTMHYRGRTDGQGFTPRFITPDMSAGGNGAVRIKYSGKTQDYTKPGTYEFLIPEGVTSIEVVCIGGGGSGFVRKAESDGNYSLNTLNDSGGSGGAYAYDTITVSSGDRLKVVVGAGGASVKGGSANGGDSYVEAIVTTSVSSIQSTSTSTPTSTTSVPSTLTTTDVKKNIFNTIDYINKADRQLWRIYPPKGKDSDFFQQYAISPFNELESQSNTDSYAGVHVIRWEVIEFPIDGNYNIELMCDDNVTIYIGNRDGEGRAGIGNGLVSVDAGGDEVIISKKGFSAPGQSTGKSLETKFFKAGKYRIRAELEQSAGEPFAKGNPMALALNITTSVVENNIVSARSWNDNPMGVALTIEAPTPTIEIPQEPIPQQQGRCPNNPIWTTRFPNGKEKWYPVKYNGNPEAIQSESWSKFMNRYAISPIAPYSLKGSDGGGIIYRNSWDLDIPYDGFYALRSTVDNAARILIDGQIVAYADYIRGDGRKNISAPLNVFRSMTGFDDSFAGFEADGVTFAQSVPGAFGYMVDYPRAVAQGFTDADIRNYLETEYKGELGPLMKEKLNDPNWGRATITLPTQTPGQIFNWRTENPESHKIFLTKGRHKIEVEVENRKTDTFEFFDEKIFSTKDWLIKPPESTAVITTTTTTGILCHAGGGFGGLFGVNQNNVGKVLVGKGGNGAPGLAPGLGPATNVTEKTGGGAGTPTGTPTKSSGVNLNGTAASITQRDIKAGEYFGLPRRFYVIIGGGDTNYSGLKTVQSLEERQKSSPIDYQSLNGGVNGFFKSGYGYGGSFHFNAVVWNGNTRWIDPASAGGGSGAVQIKFGGKTQDYTTPGTYEFIVPDGVTTIDVTCIGGGGSGYCEKRSDNVYQAFSIYSLTDSGGSGGAYATNTVSVTPGSKLKVVVGSGGAVVDGGSANGEDTYVESISGTVQVAPPTPIEVSNTAIEIVNQSPSAVGVIYEGPTPIANYKGDFISPYLQDVNASPNEEIQGKSWIFRWTNVNFPETGQYTLESEADDQLIIRVDGTEVGRAKVFGGRQKTNFNATAGKRTVELELSNIRIENTGFDRNPVVGFAQITKATKKATGVSASWTQNPIGISAMLIPPPCPKLIKGRGVVTDVIVDDPGNGYPRPGGGGYPVSLRLKAVEVPDSGINYRCGEDQIQITPDNGAVLDYRCDTFGRIIEVIVLNPGLGFTSYPEITIPSNTGIGFRAIPQFEIVRDPIVTTPKKLIQVTDLVGLKQTGYVDGRPYYGAVFYKDGIRYAGFYETVGDLVQVYDTLQESITAQVTTPPSAIQRQGTDISSNNPRLNLPGTPENLI